MQRKHYVLASLITAATCAVLAFTTANQAQAQDKKADPNGTWTWSVPGRNGGPDRVSTLKLKVDGDKVTGTLSTPGRGGGAPTETAIEDGKIKGDEVSFTVTREFNGNKFVTKYNGKLSGDSIKGKMSMDRNGQATDRDWEAKRGTEKK
jgi:hypothetical protein